MTEDEAPLIGQVLGNRYRIISILGSGGMGVVYEAEHLGLERPVAVKVLNPVQAKKKNTVKRFQMEARAAGGIGHPNICEVYDMGWLEDGCPYLVMERLHGQTLADRIRKSGGLPFLEAVEVLSQVLAGLMAAHEKGIMHRDIKPENIFLSRRTNADPVAKILDFGVSKGMAGGVEEPLDLTRTGMVMGTPYYMSPEQARGERNLDARVDVYACGVMLYECLTGRRPFLAPNYNALLLQILTENPRPARDLRPDLPAPFEAIMRRAMARARDDRYPTAAALRRDLQHVGKQLGGSHEPSSARRQEAAPERAPQAPAPYTQPAPQPAHAAHGQQAGHAPHASPPAPPAAPSAPFPHVRPAAGAPPRVAPGTQMPGPMVASPFPSGANAIRRHTVRMNAPPPMPAPQAKAAPPPVPPSHEEKMRAPVAGARPPHGSHAPHVPAAPSTEDLPKLFDTSPSNEGTPSQHVRPHPVTPQRPAPRRLDAVEPRKPEPLVQRKPEAAPSIARKFEPAPPAPIARKTEPMPAPRKVEAHDFSDAPTYVISREEILGDFLAGGLGPQSSHPTEISDWDAETTVTTAPPEWEGDTNDDAPMNAGDTYPPPPADRMEALRKRIEDEYGDLPVDDATLVHRAREPRRK